MRLVRARPAGTQRIRTTTAMGVVLSPGPDDPPEIDCVPSIFVSAFFCANSVWRCSKSARIAAI
jgi:anthranilate/para-aminobenzoate synthase component II